MAWFLSRFFGWSLGMLRRARLVVACVFGFGAVLFVVTDPRSPMGWLIAAVLAGAAWRFWVHVDRMSETAQQIEQAARQGRPQGGPDDAGA